jgi:hypothetical protein
MPFEFTPVESSQFKAVAYDSASKKLRIQFKNGTYEYDDVPAETHAALMSSASKGKYFIDNIKKAPFVYRKLPDSPT